MKVTLIGLLSRSKGMSSHATALVPLLGGPSSGILHSPHLHLHRPEAMRRQGKG